MKNGFTLIEIMIVVAIIAIFVAIPSFNRAYKKAHAKEATKTLVEVPVGGMPVEAPVPTKDIFTLREERHGGYMILTISEKHMLGDSVVLSGYNWAVKIR